MPATESINGPAGLDLDGRNVLHLCVDMQRMFAEDTEWNTPWMERVLPVATRLVGAFPEDTILTRFIPPRTAEDVPGSWRVYFERWRDFTLDRMEPGLVDLVAPLAGFADRATVLDKPAFSPFHGTDLDQRLRARGVDTLVISGAETDVCVLAAVLSAIDHGYFVVLPKDALCSSADETHDALMVLYGNRFGQQVCLSDSEEVLAKWSALKAGAGSPSGS